MSGGSWDYLYCKDVDELVQRDEMLQGMADRLAGLGYADDVARETQELVLILRQFKNHARVIADRLSPIWRAVEWWDSSDTVEEDFKTALAAYRKASAGPEKPKEDAK